MHTLEGGNKNFLLSIPKGGDANFPLFIPSDSNTFSFFLDFPASSKPRDPDLSPNAAWPVEFALIHNIDNVKEK